MNDQRQRLERIAREIDPTATVGYDERAFIVRAPPRRDVPLSEEWVGDHGDGQVADEIRCRWLL